MHMAFTLSYDNGLRMPLGLGQVKDNTYRPVLLSQSKFRSHDDIKTAVYADLTEEGFDDLRVGLQAKWASEYPAFGDGNFVIWTFGTFTKVWRYYGTDIYQA